MPTKLIVFTHGLSEPDTSMNGGTSCGTRDPPLTNASMPTVEKWCTTQFPEMMAPS